MQAGEAGKGRASRSSCSLNVVYCCKDRRVLDACASGWAVFGYQGQALVFAGHVSTKRGHNRARRDITEERARAEGRVLKDRFRHRAEKFHSTSIIPSTPRRVRSATDQRGHVGQTRWATSAPRLGYTQAAS